MPWFTRIFLLLLILLSLCFGLVCWAIETGIDHVPYETKDRLGRPMGFNDRLSREHWAIVFRAVEARDFLPGTFGWTSAYFWLFLVMHGAAMRLVATASLHSPRRLLIFFGVQPLLFPIGIPGLLVLPGYLVELPMGRLDRESVIDIPFFWCTAHAAWLYGCTLCVIAHFLQQRRQAWRALRSKID